MRERFKTTRVCSSDNYALSKKLHKQELSKNHCKLQEMLVKEEIILKKVAYIKVFGKFIPLKLKLKLAYKVQVRKTT